MINFWVNPNHAPQLAAGLLLLVGSLLGCRSVVDSGQPLSLAESAKPEAAVEKSVSDRPRAFLDASPDTPTNATTDRQTEAAEAVLTSTVMQRTDDGLRPRKIDSRGWYCDQSVPLYLSLQQGKPRWRHAALESLMAQADIPHATLRAGTRSADPEVQATAWIGQLRSGNAVAPEALADLVLSGETAATTQAALIEALATQKHPQQKPVIERLFAERESLVATASQTDAAVGGQLEEQLWVALAMTTNSCRTDSRFVESFSESSPAVQRTLLDLMLRDGSAPVPMQIDDYFTQSSPEAIRRLGLWEAYLRTVAPFEVLERHVRSPDFRTRESALIGLGREGSPDAQKILSSIDDNDPTLLQVAAVTAWGLISEHDHWSHLAEAQSWRVRLAVTHWMPLNDARQPEIERLQQDEAPQVRQSMEARLAQHGLSSPVGDDGADPPALSDAPSTAELSSASATVRITPEEAVAILQWISDAQDAPDPQQKAAARAELTSRPAVVLAAMTLAAKQLATYENPFLFQEFLPSHDPAFGWLLEAGSHSESLSVRALRKLEQQADQQSDKQPLHELIVWRLAEQCGDFSVTQWDALLGMIRRDGRAPARQIAALALEHPVPQIRLAACQYVARFPEGVQPHQIESSLEDEIPAVRVAAINALVGLHDPAKDVVFVDMLTDRSIDVQLAAAHALDRLGEPRGVQHLYRMTYDASRKTRLLATQALAARGQQEDLHALVRLLDDETPIKAAALIGLEKIVPTDEHPSGISDRSSVDARCQAWKQWFRRHNQNL